MPRLLTNLAGSSMADWREDAMSRQLDRPENAVRGTLSAAFQAQVIKKNAIADAQEVLSVPETRRPNGLDTHSMVV